MLVSSFELATTSVARDPEVDEQGNALIRIAVTVWKAKCVARRGGGSVFHLVVESPTCTCLAVLNSRQIVETLIRGSKNQTEQNRRLLLLFAKFIAGGVNVPSVNTRDFVLKTLAQELKGHPLAHFVANLLKTMG